MTISPLYNGKVPAKIKEDFDFKIPIDMSVWKPKSWAVKCYGKSENESNAEKKRGKGVPQ